MVLLEKNIPFSLFSPLKKELSFCFGAVILDKLFKKEGIVVLVSPDLGFFSLSPVYLSSWLSSFKSQSLRVSVLSMLFTFPFLLTENMGI